MLDALKRNLRQEQHVIMEMNFNTIKKIFSPIQACSPRLPHAPTSLGSETMFEADSDPRYSVTPREGLLATRPGGIERNIEDNPWYPSRHPVSLSRIRCHSRGCRSGGVGGRFVFAPSLFLVGGGGEGGDSALKASCHVLSWRRRTVPR